MTETEMMEVLHVILKTICVLIPRIFFQCYTQHAFFKILILKVKPTAIGFYRPIVWPIAFYRPPNATDSLNTFWKDFQKNDKKSNEIYLFGDLISTYLKTQNLIKNKISHMNLKIPSLSLQRLLPNTFMD